MPFQAVPQTVHCTLEGVVDSQLTINDVYFQNTAAPNLTNMQALVDALDTWFRTTLAGELSENWSTTRVRAIDLSTDPGLVAERGGVAPGGVASEAAPNNVAMAVSFRTGFSGRSGRGRNFVPAIPNAMITLNTMDAGFINAIVDAYLALMGAGSFVAGWQLVVVSRFTGGALRAVGLPQPVTNILSVTTKVRSMRSREVGHGA